MKAPSTKVRFSEAQKLLDYGFNNFEYKKFAEANEVVKTVEIQKGTKDSIEVVYENTIGTILKKGDDSNIEQIINIPDTIQAPINKGDKIGEIVYTIDGMELSRVNIIANESAEKNKSEAKRS